jgi:hypothetical protein
MAILVILEQWIGFPHLPEDSVTTVLAVIWTILVYIVPNKDV